MDKLKLLWAAHKLPIILGGLLLVMGLALALYLQGRSDGRAKADLAREKANVEAIRTNDAAKEKAAEQRATDAAEVRELEKELTDAVKDLPDAMPSARRVARACAQLRAQGEDTARLPQCRRSAG